METLTGKMPARPRAFRDKIKLQFSSEIKYEKKVWKNQFLFLWSLNLTCHYYVKHGGVWWWCWRCWIIVIKTTNQYEPGLGCIPPLPSTSTLTELYSGQWWSVVARSSDNSDAELVSFVLAS